MKNPEQRATGVVCPRETVSKAIRALQIAQGKISEHHSFSRRHIDEALELLGEAERNDRDMRAEDYVTNKEPETVAKPTHLPDLGRAFELLERIESGDLDSEPLNQVTRAAVAALTAIVKRLATEKWGHSNG